MLEKLSDSCRISGGSRVVSCLRSDVWRQLTPSLESEHSCVHRMEAPVLLRPSVVDEGLDIPISFLDVVSR